MTQNRPLWAPWRIEFLCGNESPNPGRIEEKLIVCRAETCFVILNRFPYNSGHLMVAPYRHAADLTDLSEKERYEMMDITVAAKQCLSEVMYPEAFNIGFNLGHAAGAGVADHIHMHIVPRWNGDTNFMPVISNTRCVPETLEATAELIREKFRV
jgi:ATP adenylyltransferase